MRKKLSARFVETVTTDLPRVEYHDTDEDGLMLRVSRAGGKAWVFRYRRKSDGRRRFVSLGAFPAIKLEPARVAAAKHRVAVSEGHDPAAGIQAKREALTFRELCEKWQRDHAATERSPKTRLDDASMLARYILPTLGDLKADDVKRRDLADMLASAKTAVDGRKGHTKGSGAPRRLTHRPNRVFELTRAVIRWAVEHGYMLGDPTVGMKKPVKREQPRERELSPSEIATAWNNLDKLPAGPALVIAIKLALVTGQRIGEVCGIAKAELTLDGPLPVWVLPRDRTKNSETTRVPLSPLAVRLIREALALAQRPLVRESKADVAPADSPFLFPARAKRDATHGPIEANAATVALFRGRDKLGVAHFRVHDLRRTAATRMAEMGVNPHTISLILNHVSASKSTITGKVYVQYGFDKEKREALDAWSARLEKIVAGTEGANVVALPERVPA